MVLIKHRRYADDRGSFMELFRQQEFAAYFSGYGVDGCRDICFVQDNLSRSRQGTLRGLHYQVERPQGKAGAGDLRYHLRCGGGFASGQCQPWSVGGSVS